MNADSFDTLFSCTCFFFFVVVLWPALVVSSMSFFRRMEFFSAKSATFFLLRSCDFKEYACVPLRVDNTSKRRSSRTAGLFEPNCLIQCFESVVPMLFPPKKRAIFWGNYRLLCYYATKKKEKSKKLWPCNF